jgi:hypothetical protein
MLPMGVPSLHKKQRTTIKIDTIYSVVIGMILDDFLYKNTLNELT